MKTRTLTFVTLCVFSLHLIAGSFSTQLDVLTGATQITRPGKRKPKQKKPDTKSIVIIYDNDVHCNLDGYAKMAGLRDAVRDTSWSCCVSCGDYLQGGTPGSISKGQYIVDVMKEVNYAAIALGNHEFDFGYDQMKYLISQINAPTTCVNFINTTNGKLDYAPYIMHKMGSKQVAFIGALTPTTRYTEEYGFCDKDGNFIFELAEDRIYQLVENAAKEARKEGANYVIVLSHLGETENFCGTTSHDLIKATTDIDVVLDGHSHSVIPSQYVKNREGKDVLITQTGTQFANIGKLVIKKDGRISSELIPLKDIPMVNARVQEVTDSVKALFHEQVSKYACHSDVPIDIYDKNGKRTVRVQECNAGDLVTDAYRHLTGADISITNGGGIRKSLPAGDLTYGDIIALLPYENYLTVIETTGQKIIDVLNACTKFLPEENGDFPQVSGLKYTIDMNANPRVTEVLIEGKDGSFSPIDPNKKYTVGTIDYCVFNGGLQNIFKQEKVLKQNLSIYSEALIEYVTKNLGGSIGEEYSKPQGRITIIN